MAVVAATSEGRKARLAEDSRQKPMPLSRSVRVNMTTLSTPIISVTGGSLPRPMGREKKMGFSISDEFDLSYFREPTDQPALLALALMREGRGLNHPAYAFLSFYRVVEVAFPDGRQ